MGNLRAPLNLGWVQGGSRPWRSSSVFSGFKKGFWHWAGSLGGRIFLSALLLGLSACSSKAPKKTVTPAPSSQIHLQVVRDALSFQGIPYRWGEETPERGFDCSGFVQYVYGRYGVPLPRTAYEMAMSLPPVDEGRVRPGDLVFFNTTGHPYSHVGIYIGRDRFVHASSAKGEVLVSPLDAPYWSDHFLGLRRPHHGHHPVQGGGMVIGRWIP